MFPDLTWHVLTGAVFSWCVRNYETILAGRHKRRRTRLTVAMAEDRRLADVDTAAQIQMQTRGREHGPLYGARTGSDSHAIPTAPRLRTAHGARPPSPPSCNREIPSRNLRHSTSARLSLRCTCNRDSRTVVVWYLIYPYITTPRTRQEEGRLQRSCIGLLPTGRGALGW